MARVIVSRMAREDLIAIHGYIQNELDNPDAAVKLMLEMNEKIQSLSMMPDRGAPLDAMISVRTDFRFLICGSYRIFYSASDGTVEVYRILNQRQNHIKALFE